MNEMEVGKKRKDSDWNEFKHYYYMEPCRQITRVSLHKKE